MKLKLNWHQSIELGAFPYTVPTANIPKKPGVYIFLRVHGQTAEAIYVGKAGNLQSRIKTQLNNLKLMRGIQSMPNGKRRLVYAEFVARPGQSSGTALPICEKTLIRYYLSLGHELLNIQGAKLRYHELDSQRNDLRKFLPISTKMLIG